MFRRIGKLFSRRQFILLLAISLFAGSAYVLGWSSLLTVKRVEVVGAPTKGDREVIGTVVEIGDRLARVDTRAVALDLKKISWLKSAHVSRNWLQGSVTITVTTREPLAIVGDKFIDSEGVSFSLPHREKFNVPLILADTKQAKGFAASLIDTLPLSFRKNIEVVSVEGLQTATLLINLKEGNRIRPLTVRWGDEANGSLKLRAYQSLLALPENAKIVFMDLSAPHAPIVR
jgi:cell division protein FtsQ